MGKTMTSRLPDEMAKTIEEIAEIEKLDKSSVIRRLLDKGITQWKEEFALKLYQDREVSLGKAAEIASLSIWEFLDKLAEKKIPINYDTDDLLHDLKNVDSLLDEG
jgi:predicted HTH domain antitoxin